MKKARQDRMEGGTRGEGRIERSRKERREGNKTGRSEGSRDRRGV